MTAGTCCRRPAQTAERTETLQGAAQRMGREHVGSLVVVAEGRPVAMLTDRDLALAVLADGLEAAAPVAAVAGGAPLVSVREDAPIAAACAAMRSEGVRRLPVVDGGDQLVGMLTMDDLVRLAAADLTALADVASEQSPPRARSVPAAAGAGRGARHYARPVATVGDRTPVRDVAARLRESRLGCVVVLDDGGAPCGLVTDRDLALRVVAAGLAPDTPVSRVMSAPLFAIGAEEDLRAVARRMSADGVRRLPVVEHGRLLGLVTHDDLLAALGAELSDLGQAARAALAGGRAR